MNRVIAVFAVTLMLAGAGAAQEGPRLDVAFLLDATGSMGDEIGAVKEKIREMISDIALGDPPPDVRFGIVAYRDRGDEYVTQVYELTRDIDRIVENLDRIQASGGGDYPESFNEGLHVTLDRLAWEEGEDVGRLVFLIADAPPHMDYPDDFDYRDEIQAAVEKGIAVHAIGASGLDQVGEDDFREVADGTGGQFQWLAYQTQYVTDDGEEVIITVEGRTTTYTKGDETWVVEPGEAPPEGLGWAGGVADGIRTTGGLEDAAAYVDVDAEGGGGASSVSSSTNLDDLITKAIRDAAEDSGVSYEGEDTAVESSSWGAVKAQHQRR